MPWTMNVKSSPRRMLTRASPRSLDLLHRATGRLPHRDAPIAVLHPVALEDLEPLLLPGAGDAEDGDRLGGVPAELETGLDHSAGDDVDARVGDDRHHHGNLLDPLLAQHLLGQPGGLRHRGVAADLRVVGRPAALAANGVRERQRAAPRADHETEVAVEAVILAWITPRWSAESIGLT